MSKFDAAIGALLLRISHVSLMGEWRDGAVKEMKSCSDAIRVLEAAAKVDKDNAEEWLLDGMAQGRDYHAMMAPYKGYDIKDYDRAKDEIYALLAALPALRDGESPDDTDAKEKK